MEIFYSSTELRLSSNDFTGTGGRMLNVLID